MEARMTGELADLPAATQIVSDLRDAWAHAAAADAVGTAPPATAWVG